MNGGGKKTSRDAVRRPNSGEGESERYPIRSETEVGLSNDFIFEQPGPRTLGDDLP